MQHTDQIAWQKLENRTGDTNVHLNMKNLLIIHCRSQFCVDKRMIMAKTIVQRDSGKFGGLGTRQVEEGTGFCCAEGKVQVNTR